MRTVPLAEVIKLDAGEGVPQTKGVIERFFDRYTGTNQHGDWSIESFVLTDGPTKIKVTASNRDALDRQALKGRTVWLISQQKQKGDGFTGVSVAIDNYNGKSEKILKVTGRAEIVRADGSNPPQTQQAPAAPATQQANPPAAQPAAQAGKELSEEDKLEAEFKQRREEIKKRREAEEAAKKAAEATQTKQEPGKQVSWGQVKLRVEKIGNLYELVGRKVCLSVRPAMKEAGYEMTPEHIQTAIHTLMIRYGELWQFDDMPTGKPKPPATEATPKEPPTTTQQPAAEATPAPANIPTCPNCGGPLQDAGNGNFVCDTCDDAPF